MASLFDIDNFAAATDPNAPHDSHVDLYRAKKDWDEWQEIVDAGFYKPDGEPLICTECLGMKFSEKTEDPMGYEFSVHCDTCKKQVAYWAYGSFQP